MYTMIESTQDPKFMMGSNYKYRCPKDNKTILDNPQLGQMALWLTANNTNHILVDNKMVKAFKCLITRQMKSMQTATNKCNILFKARF